MSAIRLAEAQPVLQGDSLSLVQIYNATNGPNWTYNTGWLTMPVTSWVGLSIELWPPGSNFRYVSEINLSNNNLTGTLPLELTGFYCMMSISLYNNNLTGSLPEWIGHIDSLGSISIDYNHFTGQIPLSMGSLRRLQEFWCRNNDFYGPFPDTIVDCPELRRLGISNNHFTLLKKRQPLLQLHTLHIDHNALDFDAIVPYVYVLDSLNWFLYDQQDSILFDYDTTLLVGDTLKLDSYTGNGGGINTYNWKKGNVNITTPSLNSLYVKPNVQLSDSGDYSCDVFNNIATALTLHRRLIHVHVVDSVNAVGTTVSPQEVDIQYNNADGLLNIRMNFSSAGQVECYLYDITGRQVMRLYKGSTRQQELHYYPAQIVKAGVYIVRLKGQDLSLAKRILVR